MAFSFYNPNPKNARVGDCAVRAISKATNQSWQDVYVGLVAEGLALKDMPSANYVWGMYLKKFGFQDRVVASSCPECVTVSEFALSHPKGRYVLATQNHVVAVVDGDYFDTWDSGNEIVLYFFTKET